MPSLFQGEPSKAAQRIEIWFRIILILVAVTLAACQPGLTPTARPTPAVLTIQSTRALQPLQPTYRNCVRELPNMGLVLLDVPAPAFNFDQAVLGLRWGAGPKQSGYAAVVGQEELVVVVSPKNPTQKIAWQDLQAIYQGSLPDSSPAKEVRAWAYPAGEDIQAVFESMIGTTASRVIFLAPDPAAMREAVAGDARAIGFLPRRWLDSSVNEVSVQGLDPARMRQPILALSKTEPKGLEKAWLICLQQRLSE